MIQTQDLPVVPLPDKVDSGKSAFEALKGLGFDDAITSIANGIVHFSFRLLICILVFYIGKFIIRKIYTLVQGIMINRKIDASLSTFVLSLIKIVLYFILIVTIVGILGIETSSFLALFASAGVAIGMALSGTLQNFAGGVLILLLKPYKVGDYIEAQGFAGTVKEIQIFHTLINTPDNKAIIIPNGGLSTGSINNYSFENYRRVDWSIGLSYGDDYPAAKKAILEILESDPRIVKRYIEDDIQRRKAIADKDKAESAEPVEEVKEGWWARMRRHKKERQEALKEKIKEQTTFQEGLPVKKECPPFVALSQLADSSIVLTVRAWVAASEYWGVYFDMNERFYKELPEKGFNFPFPQLDVHLADVPENFRIK